MRSSSTGPPYTPPPTVSSRPLTVPRVFLAPPVVEILGPALPALLLLHDRYGFRPVHATRRELADLVGAKDSGRLKTLERHLDRMVKAGCLTTLDPVPGKNVRLQIMLPTLVKVDHMVTSDQGAGQDWPGSSRGEGLGSRDSGLESQGKIKGKGSGALRRPVVDSGGQLQLVLLTVHEAIEKHRPRPPAQLARQIATAARLFSRRMGHISTEDFARAIEHLLVKAVDRREPVESVYAYLRGTLNGVYADGAEGRAALEKAEWEAEDRAAGIARRSGDGWRQP